jgi:hypothetical protein
VGAESIEVMLLSDIFHCFSKIKDMEKEYARNEIKVHKR